MRQFMSVTQSTSKTPEVGNTPDQSLPYFWPAVTSYFKFPMEDLNPSVHIGSGVPIGSGLGPVVISIPKAPNPPAPEGKATEAKSVSGKRPRQVETSTSPSNGGENVESDPLLVCRHKRVKTSCKECKRTCVHGKRKSKCRDCDGGEICQHGRERIRCRECKGSQICVHDKVSGIFGCLVVSCRSCLHEGVHSVVTWNSCFGEGALPMFCM